MNTETAVPTHTPANMLLTAALALHGAPNALTPQAKQIAQNLIGGALAAATAGGYTQADILETLLSRRTVSRRVARMAREACEAAGTAALRHAFERVGLAGVTNWNQ